MTRVVMVVGNDITTDTRVRKSALALASAGYDVIVVCHASNGRASDSYLGNVLVRRVPIQFAKRDLLKARIERRKQLLKPLGVIHPRLHKLGQRGLTALEKAWGSTRIGLHWPRLVPEVLDTEQAFIDVIVGLRPDVIHAHDVQVMRLAALAAKRANSPWIYDAHEWVSGLSRYGRRTRRVVGAWAQLEEEWITRAAAVVTVSPQLATALKELHRLDRLPTVVLNAPPLAARRSLGFTLRGNAGIDQASKVLVYAGGVTAARGVQEVVEALPLLPGVHFVLIPVPHGNTWIVQRMMRRAQELGVGDRFHIAPAVRPDEVTSYLSDADVGIIPLRHFPSHEMALTNKLFEYLHAQIPVVVSDCKAQTNFVHENCVGEIFVSGDHHSLARAVRRVLARPKPTWNSSFLEKWSWQPQAQKLIDLYAELCGRPQGRVVVEVVEPPEKEVPHEHRDDTVTFAIGPANSAGQAWAWTTAAAVLPGVTPVAVSVVNNKYDFPCDIAVDAEKFARDHTWARNFADAALATWTHVLLEAGRPIFGTLNGRNFVGDAAMMSRRGITVGLVFHGSELRNPESHARREKWSPFADGNDVLTTRLQNQWNELMPAIREFEGATFVSTPDLLEDLPTARWLPVTVDERQWWTPQRIIRRVPLVVHMPSNSALKGTALVSHALQRLHDRGLCEVQLVSGVRPDEARQIIRNADVIIDQFALGSYGALAVQAMAAGKPVVGHVSEAVREFLNQQLPIVEATPDVLEDVLTGLVRDPDRMHDLGRKGREFVSHFHNGYMARTVLAPFLGRSYGAGVAVTLGTLTTTAP